jgi:hypothetical protein
MATWIAPVDSETDPDAPLTSSLAKRWDNNVIAMTEGASGAPKVLDGALSTTVTNAGQDWVNSRLALTFAGAYGSPLISDFVLSSSATTTGAAWVRNRTAIVGGGEVGTYAMLSIQTVPGSNQTYSSGATASGSDLRYASASGSAIGGAPSGKWRSMGYAIAGTIGTYPLNDSRRVTMWLRYE